MNYPGKIMQTNCSTETECNGQPGDAREKLEAPNRWLSLSNWLPQFSVTITARTPVASFHYSVWPRKVVIALALNQLGPQLSVEKPAGQLKPQTIQLHLKLKLKPTETAAQYMLRSQRAS